ncbi:MAG: hypothetical protein ACKVPY_02805 [Paracoccaceae bacterium]
MQVKTAIFAAALTVAPAVAAAGSGFPCFERAKLVEALSSKYKEGPSAGGLQSDTEMVEIWTSPETGTFTVIVTRANGTSCVVATGTGWQSLASVTPEGVQG